MPNTFTLQVNRRDPRPRSPRLRNLGASASGSGTTVVDGKQSAAFSQQLAAAIADLTERIANAYLSKLHDDVAAGRITFEQGLRALRTVNVEAADLVITAGQNDQGGNIDADGDISAGGDIEAGGDLDVDGHASIGGNLTAGGTAGSSSFDTGLLGNGWRIDNLGHGELDSLTLRKFLEVPELRYNRTSVHVGVDWHTCGAGLIEEVYDVEVNGTTRHIIKLKLEDGEAGAVAEGDMCMGIYHDKGTPANNYTPQQDEASVVDDHNGNFKFAGFMTIYFKVVAICDEDGDSANPDSRNQYFIYELRPASSGANGWSGQHHPQPSMTFACYANHDNSSRQSCAYATTDYIVLLTGMTDWTYDGDNISYIRGNLNNFTIPERVLVNGEWVTNGRYKQLEGYGIAFGKAYMWGDIDQFNRAPYLVSQQLWQVALNLAPSVVLANPSWRTTYTWHSTPQVPSPTAPYLYSYWDQTYSDNSHTFEGPVLSGYDNSLFNLSLNKDVVSAALSNWYDDGEPTDVLQFDVQATLSLGNAPHNIAISEAAALGGMNPATASSDISGFSYTVEVSGSTATFHITISGYVAQQVDGLLAENAFIRFRCYGNDVNYAEHTLAIIENRQGNDGNNGDDAVAYTLEASQTTYNLTDAIGIDLRFYRSVSAQKESCVGWFISAEYDYAGQMVGTPRLYGASGSSIRNIIGWRPQSGSAARTVFLAFVSFADAVSYLGYIRGVYQSYDTEPVASTTLLLAEPVIDLLLSHQGTINYPVNASRLPEALSMKVHVRMMVNNVQQSLTALTTSAIIASPASGMASVGNDPAPDPTDDDCAYCEFETVTGTAVASLMQIYRITASVTYGGKTYERYADISFCAVTAGQSVRGQQGLQGCVIRLRGEWRDDIPYVNESGLEVSTIRYIDVVQYENNGTIRWYERNTYTDGYGLVAVGGATTYQRPTNSSYWSESNSFEFIATKLLLADNAHITFGQGNQLLIVGEDGETIVGGLTGFDTNSPSAYRLWLGATLPGDAPFSVTHDGTLVAANVNSKWQDLSSCHSAGEQPSAYANEHGRRALKLDDVRSGTSVSDSNGNEKSVLPRVYNIIANYDLVQLPTSSTFLGTHVLLLNNDGSFGTGTVVVQLSRDWFYGTPMLEVGTRTDPIVSNPVTVVEFVGGVMEFVAVPHPYDATKCKWALMSDAANIKYFNGEIQDFNFPDEE